MSTLEELTKAAQAAEARLRSIPGDATRIAATTRTKMRDVGQQWDLGPEQVRRGQQLARKDAAARLDQLNHERNAAVAAIAEYVSVATAAPVASTTDAELRRGRAYSAAERAIDSERNTAHRPAKFRALVNDAEQRHDLAMLEALRELGRHLNLQGIEIAPEVLADLDRTAGPPAARLARELEARASTGAGWVQQSIGSARRTLDANPNDETGLLAATYDGTTIRVDDWTPAPQRIEPMPASNPEAVTT